ncbi:glycoside hydrolase family 13 protein [Piloderma croceum F 1598]|uniref:Glycoside hydrolase family 13 protein n=1 Tax=Piloderma croceum (strain F 1598) TaxID=765440 RepID=A0A0C3C5B7_PILCF|nr:glycoside hydrolase family 13 protein [Piloderma croceum F 1598]
MVFEFKNWLLERWKPSPALSRMRLGPEGSTDNPLMIQFFTWDGYDDEMSWWKHLETEIPNLAAQGFTQVWLPPPNKAAKPRGQGYDAYDLWDLGEFDQKGSVATRWGTKEELLQACNVAKQNKLDILIDAVLNHKLGADRNESFPAVLVDPKNRLKDIGHAREIEGPTVFDFSARNGKHSGLRWDSRHFTGVDWDQRTNAKGIYRITGEGHKGWSKHVDKELGNYDYLLGADIDHRHPEVRKDLLAWGTWVLDTTGATGFRLDAIKHMDLRFVQEFLKNTRQCPGNERMFAVAEYWSARVNLILPYITAFRGQTAFFDVPLHDNFYQASKQGSQYDLRKVLDRTIVKARPGDAVTFVDNHERQIGQSLESWVESNFKLQAYALILLRPDGHPCVFYGDLYPNRECYNASIAHQLRVLLEARKNYAYGRITDYFIDQNCIGFVRMGDSKHPGLAAVITNGAARSNHSGTGTETYSIRMNVGKELGGMIYRSYLQPFARVEITADGWGHFFCSSNSVQIWVKADR